MDWEAQYGVWYKTCASAETKNPNIKHLQPYSCWDSHEYQKSDANFCGELAVPDPVDKHTRSFEALQLQTLQQQ